MAPLLMLCASGTLSARPSRTGTPEGASVINAYMNISVSVITAAAMARLQALQGEVAKMQSALVAAGAIDGPGNGRQLSQLSKYGNQLQWTGRQLQYNFSLPLAIAGAAATHFALENEKAFTRISKVYGDATMSASVMKAELASLQKAFVALSNHYGVHQAEVLNIAADWAAAGASGVALARGVEQTLITMVLGEMQAKEATEALIAIQAQYNLSSQQLVDTIAKLNVVENQTGISLQGLIQGFARAAGVAREAGIDVEHLAAMLAALTPTAGSAAQAGNALKTIISRILSPTGEARDILEAMGIAVNDLAWKSANGSQRIELLAKKFHDLDDAQKAVVSSTLASRYQINRFEALMDSVYKAVDQNANTVGYYGRALDATADRAYYLAQAESELNAVLESNPQRLKQIWVILENALADIIQPLIPVILMAATVIKDLVEAFRGLPPEVQKAITVGLLFLALFGPLIRYIGSTMTLIGELSWFFAGIAKALLLPIRGIGGLIGVLGSLALAGPKALAGLTAALAVGLPKAIGASRNALMLFAVYFSKLRSAFVVGLALASWFASGFFSVMAATVLGVQRIGSILLPAWRAILVSMRAITLAWGGGFTAVWAAVMLSIQRITAVIAPGIGGIWAAFLLGFRRITAVGAAAAAATWRAFLFGLQLITAAGTIGLAAKFRAMWVALQVVMLAGSRGLLAVWRATMISMAALVVGTGGVFALLGRGLVTTLRGIGIAAAASFTKGFLAGWLLFKRAIPTLIAFARAAGMAIVAAFSSPWGWAIAAVIALLLLFRKQIGQLIQNIVGYFNNLPSGVAAAFRPLVNLFYAGVRAIQRAFYALPQGVQNAMLAVVRIVHQAAMAVYRLFSYLNPFAHHSPSLVENVTNGMAEVRKQFATVTSISGPIKQAYADIKAFGKAIAGLIAAQDRAKQADDRSSLAKFSPGAIDEYNSLIADLRVLTPLLENLNDAVQHQQAIVDDLKSSLDAANATLDAANNRLDELQKTANAASDNLDAAKQSLQNWANTPIEGMREMSDQIFANEIAQKRLRLEMMKMEDAVGGIDNLRDSLNKIQGEIELLSGTQADLRAGGAGSEILSQYDDEIAKLRQQQDTINETASEYDKLSDELEKLQRQGEMLDLENSLKFDELTRQIEQAANAMEEMPFDEIMKGIQQANADIAKYTEEVDKANAAVEAQQKAVDAAAAARDAIQARYDAESAKLEQLRDQYGKVEQAIQDINSALHDMTSAAEDAIRRQEEAARKAAGGGSGGSPALDNFNGAAGGNFPEVGGLGGLGREGGLGDQSALIDQFTQDIAKKTGEMFAGFDVFGPIKKKWNEFTSWWGANVNPAFASAAGGVGEIWKNTAGKIDWAAPFRGIDWKGIFGNIGDTVRNVFSTAREWGSAIWRLFREDIVEIWNTIREKFKKAIDEIAPEIAKFKDELKPASEAVKSLWDNIKPVAAIIGGVFLFALKLVASVISNTLGPALDIVIGLIKGLVGIIRGWVQIIIGLINGDLGKVWEGIKTVWSSTLEAIGDVLKGAWDLIKGIVKGVVEGIYDFFKWLYDELVGHSIVPDTINAIVDWFKGLPEKVWTALKDLGSKILEKVKDAWNSWTKSNSENWTKITTFLTSLPGKAADAIKDLKSKLTGKASEAWEGFKSTSSNVWNSISSWISGRPAAAGSAISGIVGTLKSKGTEAMNSLKTGLSNTWGSVSSWLGGLGSRIKSAVGSLGSLLYNIGASILQSLLNGMKSKWDDVKNFVGGIGPWIKDHKGPIEKDRKLLVEEGSAIMVGLHKGMTAEWPEIQSFAKSIAPAIVSAMRAGGAAGLKGVSLGYTPGGIGHAEARVTRAANGSGTVTYGGETRVTNIYITGNLEFPNIKSSDDAETFISNLESLAGGGSN